MPTEFNLEDKIFANRGIKEEDEESIPLKLSFLAAYLRIALCIVSSSIAVDHPPPPRAWRSA
jgi:hypothetical protein